MSSDRPLAPPNLVGAIVDLTKSSLFRWDRCRREYLLGDLLDLPATDPDERPIVGDLVHDLLRILHREGPCTDARRLDDLVESHVRRGSEDEIRALLERHRTKCPRDAETVGHELSRARFHRSPDPMFMLSGRIDAAWRRADGVLDVRDYKTGGRWIDEVRQDLAARAYAFLMAPEAQRQGLHLKVSYEFLSPEVEDDPDPYEPDEDALAAVEEELRALAEVIKAEREFAGRSEVAVCGRCQYRSICVDCQNVAQEGAGA